jgi:hypothetical protein
MDKSLKSKNLKYFLVNDVPTQWFTFLLSTDPDGKVVESYQIHTQISGGPIDEIFQSREPDFGDRQFDVQGASCNHFYGYNLVKSQYEKIKRAAQLFPLVQEYKNLGFKT